MYAVKCYIIGSMMYRTCIVNIVYKHCSSNLVVAHLLLNAAGLVALFL